MDLEKMLMGMMNGSKDTETLRKEFFEERYVGINGAHKFFEDGSKMIAMMAALGGIVRTEMDDFIAVLPKCPQDEKAACKIAWTEYYLMVFEILTTTLKNSRKKLIEIHCK